MGNLGLKIGIIGMALANSVCSSRGIKIVETVDDINEIERERKLKQKNLMDEMNKSLNVQKYKVTDDFDKVHLNSRQGSVIPDKFRKRQHKKF